MMKQLTSVLLLLATIPLSAQYLETFSTPNKGYLINLFDDFTGVNWKMTPWAPQPPATVGRDIADYFQTTAAGSLESIDLDQEVCWESPLLNTAAAPTVSLSVDLHWEGFDIDQVGDPCTEASLDYIKVQYSVNGGGYTTLPNAAGGSSCATVGYSNSSVGAPFSGDLTVTQSGIAGGSNLRIRICGNTNSNSEIIRADNVSVPEAGVTLGCTAPAATATAQPITCGGPASGAVQLSVSGGTPGYTFLWSNDSTTQNLSGLQEGTYTVTVTDNGGCTATTSATVATAPFVVGTHSGDASCPGLNDGEIDLSVNGGTPPYAYAWEDLPGMGDPQDRGGLAPGTYTVTVTDSGVCTATASATVGLSVPGPYLETFDTDGKGLLSGSVCNGPDATTCTHHNFFGVNWKIYGLNALLGIEPDDFFSTSGGTLQGKDFDQIICWESPLLGIKPGGTAFSVDLAWAGFDQEPPGPDPLDLVADHIDVEYSVDGGPWVRVANQFGGGLTGHTVVYINGVGSNLTDETTVTQSNIQGNTLQIRVCGYLNADLETMRIDSVSVPQTSLYCPPAPLSLTATASPATCFGGSDGAIELSVSGGVLPYSFQWSNDAKTEDLAGVPAGLYTVTVTDQAGSSATIEGTVSQPDAIMVALDQTLTKNPLCHGSSDGVLAVSVTGGTPDYNYLWSTDAMFPVILNVPAGAYSLTVTDARGCSALLGNVLLFDPPAVQGAVSFENSVCAGQQTELTVDSITGGNGAPYQYSVDNGVSMAPDVPVNVGAGQHVATYLDSKNCSFSDTILVVEKLPSGAQIEGQDTACFSVTAYTYLLPGFSDYQWEALGALILSGQGTGAVTVQFQALGDNPLEVHFTNSEGCPDTAATTVFVDFCDATGEAMLPDIHAGPNPFGAWLSVFADELLPAGSRAWLCDALGRTVMPPVYFEKTLRFETGRLPAGLYFLNVEKEKRRGVWRVVKFD